MAATARLLPTFAKISSPNDRLRVDSSSGVTSPCLIVDLQRQPEHARLLQRPEGDHAIAGRALGQPLVVGREEALPVYNRTHAKVMDDSVALAPSPFGRKAAEELVDRDVVRLQIGPRDDNGRSEGCCPGRGPPSACGEAGRWKCRRGPRADEGRLWE